MVQKVDHNEVEKAKTFVLAKIMDYVPNSIVIRTILSKTTGNIKAFSFDSGEIMIERVIPFDTFVHIIEGQAEVVIEGISNLLDTGESIIIPAHAPNVLKANERFKMISMIIKSGYE